jgi:hypothetical protein
MRGRDNRGALTIGLWPNHDHSIVTRLLNRGRRRLLILRPKELRGSPGVGMAMAGM